MARIDEIAPDVFRLSEYVPQIDLQFNHFLIRDEEPLLFHTGYRRTFPQVRDGVAMLIDPSKLRWISFSHFESDECGALNEWLSIAPKAQAVASAVACMVNLEDFAIRPPRALGPDETLATGKYRFRYIPTPQLPHGWDAGVCFEETQGTLLCSDLFHHNGDVEPLTQSDILGKVAETLRFFQGGPLANYMPYTPNTGRILAKLAELKPRLLATQHGSAYEGDGRAALLALGQVLREVLGETTDAAAARVAPGITA